MAIAIRIMALAITSICGIPSMAGASAAGAMSTIDIRHHTFAAPLDARRPSKTAQTAYYEGYVPAIDATVALYDDQTGGNGNNIYLDVLFRALDLYIKNHDTINGGLRDAMKNAQTNSDISALQNVLNSTPYLSVISEASPCAGSNTVRVQYHKDSSFDCVNLTRAVVAPSGGSKLLFISTVDTLGRTNNALVYEVRPETRSVEFIGTVTYVGHSGFRVDFYDDQRIQASYNNRDGSRTRCAINWVRGQYQQTCR